MATAKKKASKKSAAATSSETKAKKAAKKAAAPAAQAAPKAVAKAAKKAAAPEPVKSVGKKKASKKGGRGRIVVEPPPPPISGSGLQADGVRPLDGLTVLELSRWQAAAEAGMWLARFGADVVRMDPPGDLPPLETPELFGRPAFDVYAHRGKKSLALDWAKPAASAALGRLMAKADVVICDWTDKQLKELGHSPAAAMEANAKLIWVAISGYGRSGRSAKFSGHDVNFLALSGLLGLLGGADGLPALPGIRLSEQAGGALPAVIGALLALLARDKTNRGQLVDVSQLDGVAGLLGSTVADYAATRSKPTPGREALYGRYACYNIYPVRNGRWIALGALDPKAWATLCKAIDRESMIPEQFADPERQQVLIAELTRVFQRKDIREWSEVLEGKDVCVTEVRSLGDAVQDKHLLDREMMLSYKRDDGPGTYPATGVYPQLSATPGALGDVTSETGEDSAAVLKAAGFSKKDIAELLD